MHKNRKKFIKISRKTHKSTNKKSRINKNSQKIVSYKFNKNSLLMAENLINQKILSLSDDDFK